MVKAIILTVSLGMILLGTLARANAGQEGSPAPSSGPSEVDWLAQAKQAEGARNFARAAECYVNYLKAHPDAAAIYQRLGLVYYLSDRFQDAVPALQRAFKLDPTQWSSALFLGICLYRMGQFTRALEPFHEALRLNPGLPDGHFWLGSALLALGRHDEAIVELQKVPSDSPVGLEASSLLVRAYRESAENYYRRIEKVDADSYRVHQLQAELFAWKDRNLEAVEEYRKALARAPRLEGLHRMIGDIYWQRKDYDQARKEYESEILVTPLDDDSHLRLGQYWLAKGKLDQATAHLELAAGINKNSSEAHRDLARIRLIEGDTAHAEPLLKKAAQEKPDDLFTHQLLAELYQRTNRPDLAKQELELSRRLASTGEKNAEPSEAETDKPDNSP